MATRLKKKGNGAEDKPNYQLTKEERLEVGNLRLKMQILTMDYQAKMGALTAVQEKLLVQVNERLGANLAEYRVDPETGVAVWDPQEAARLEAQVAQNKQVVEG